VDVFIRVASWDAVQGQHKVKSFATFAGQLQAIDFADCSGCAESDDSAGPTHHRFSWHLGLGCGTPTLRCNESEISAKSQGEPTHSVVLHSCEQKILKMVCVNDDGLPLPDRFSQKLTLLGTGTTERGKKTACLEHYNCRSVS
jgi:hypothetical protein